MTDLNPYEESLANELAKAEAIVDRLRKREKLAAHIGLKHLRRAEQAEAKLAKAVEMALEECPFREGTGSYNDWWYDRKTKLAELEGK